MKKHTLSKIPSLRKCNNRGFVELNGQRIYLGPWSAPETEAAYERTIAEWLCNKRVLKVSISELTIADLCLDYWLHSVEYYQKPDGSPTSTLGNIKRALKPLNALYGDTLADTFGPSSLRTLRNYWIDLDLSRRTVSYYTELIKRCFKWAVANERVRVEVYQALTTLEPLRKNRSKARETDPIKPIPQSHIDAVQPYVSSQVWALIQLQLFTGTRAGELLKLRSCDLDTTGTVWSAELSEHKTSYRGKTRTIYFGPKAQAILKPFMQVKGLQEPLFSPKDAENERYALSPTHRRPNQQKSPLKTSRSVGEYYTTDSYRRAINRACKKAGVPAWTPHQLRHNAATYIRKEFGLEAAQVILGHSRADVTQLYAEIDEMKAINIIKEVG